MLAARTTDTPWGEDRARVHRASWLGVLALAVVLSACGGAEPMQRPVGPEPMVAGTSQFQAERPAPVVVAVDPLPDSSGASGQADETVVEDDGAVKVRTVVGLLRAIRSNRVIALEPGTYELDKAQHVTTEHVRWEPVHDGQELVISGVQNLTIRAARDYRPEILATPRYAWVMRLVNVENVALTNLVLGHTPSGGCTGGVVGVEQARDVHVEGCELYGSGTIGVGLQRVSGFRFVRSSIRNCTYGIAQIDASSDVLFRDSRFVDNEEFDLVEVSSTPAVRFESCSFSGNRTQRASGYVFFKTDAGSSISLADTAFQDNDFDLLTNERSRLTVTGSGVGGIPPKALAKPDPEYNEIYALARYQRWIVAGTQAGVVFWDPVAGRVDKLVSSYITGHLLVRGPYLWAGGYRSVLRFDGLAPKTYLHDGNASGGGLYVGTRGELVVHQEKLVSMPNHWWIYDERSDRFAPAAGGGPKQAPAAIGGAPFDLFYDSLVRRNGEAWGVDFLRALVQSKGGQVTRLARQSQAYPGRDPRRLYEDPLGKLWAIDFDDGFFAYDDARRVFVHDSTVAQKASDMVVDAKRGRTWLLHYTDGLHLVEKGRKQFFDLRRLQYMRALMLDSDGSVWIGGWNALVHLKTRGAAGWSEEQLEVSDKTVASGALP